MGNLKIMKNTSSSRLGIGVVANKGWHTTTSAGTNSASTENFILQNIPIGG
jgi:hypothetical protein